MLLSDFYFFPFIFSFGLLICSDINYYFGSFMGKSSLVLNKAQRQNYFNSTERQGFPSLVRKLYLLLGENESIALQRTI